MDKMELKKIRKQILLKKLKQYGYLKKYSLIDNNSKLSFISKQQLQQLSLDFETLGKSSILTCKFTFSKEIDLDRLEKSFYFIINRHPILSTIYEVENNKINLIETKKLDWKILLYSDPLIDDNLDPKFNTPIRIRVKKNDYGIDLVIILHHIAFDEISWQILLSEISYYYSKQKPLDDGLVFSNVQPNFIVESKTISSKEYWQKYLSNFINNNIPDPFSIYRNNSNNIKKDEYKSKVIKKKLSNQFIIDFQNFAKSISVSPISLLIASVALILERKFCQDNIVIGTAIDQRETEENFKTIGNFVSIIPIIVDINSDLSKIAKKVHQDIILGFKNRFISLEDIISNLQIKVYDSRHPLIDFIVLYRNSSRRLVLYDKEYFGENIYSSSTLFDLIISIDEDDLGLTCQYKDNLIPNKISLQILNDLFYFLNNIQLKKFYDIYFDDYQKFKLSNKLCPSDDIVNKFIDLTIKQPDFIAIEYMGKQFTRIEVLQAVFKLISLIKDKGIDPFDNVIIATSKSIATPICYLSFLYYGITFIPFDITSPKYRLLNFINSSNPKLIITSDEYLFKIKDILKDSNIEILNFNISALLKPVDNFNISQIKKFESLNINQPAYIIFTSGTTGSPKGVLVSRNSLNFVLQDMADIFANNSQSYLSLSSLSFDISIFEILSPLYYGIKLIIGEDNWSKNPQKLVDKIKKLNPSIIELTPSLCNEILYYDAKCMQKMHVCCGGEKLSTKTLDLLVSNYSYVSNLYGPTEMTIITTKNNCNLSHNSSIGKALNNTVAIILDNKLRPVPNGILGELYLFGSQIAQYYINNPSLTAKKFVANPFYQGQRMYRTGDLVYKDIDTLDIYFCGRYDEQLSIHGVRVEPEEIEFEISKIKGVDQCAIKVVQVGNNSVIHGYFVGNISSLELEVELKQVLPNYLRPVSLNKIDKIPKSISGKIDRKSLPEPKFIIDSNTLPSSKLEILVANCFKQILDINNVKNKDNFFFLGGYSLQVTSLINLIESKTSIRLTVKDIFDHPTVEEIALILSKKKFSLPKNYIYGENYNYSSNFKLSDAQKRILAAYQLYDQKNLYNMPLVLKVSGQLNIELFKQSLILVLQKHKILNTIYDDISLNYGKILPWDEFVDKIDTIFHSFILDDEKIIYEKINSYIYSEFTLNTQIPIKVFYFQGLENNYLLFLLHHIVADEFSLRIIFNDIKDFYNDLKANKNNFNIQSKQYFDVIEELGKYSHHSLQFWQESFKNVDLLLDPPFANKKLVNVGTTNYHQQIVLSDKQINLLNSLKNEFKSSAYHIFISIVITLLSRLSQKDVVVGIPVLGRGNVDYEQIVGYFSNTLPIRVLSDYSMSCKDIILKTRNVVLEALDNSQVPLEKIYSNGVPFSVFIDYRSYKLPNFKTDDFIADSLNWDIRLAKFPVIILYNELDNKIDLLFSSQYYQENSSLLFKRSLSKTIDFFCNNSNNNISNINYYDISHDLYNFNYNQYFYKPSAKFYYIFEKLEQVAFENSDNYAISGEGYYLKYSQLFLLISKISSIINENNIHPDEIITIYASNRIEQLILMLGVLHSGHAYVVLDANYPQSRINFLLEQINTKLVLNAQNKAINLFFSKEILIDIHDLFESLNNKESYIKCNIPISPNELAYLCFTSGTTANPKGVLITHSGLSDFVNQVSHLYKNLYKVDNNIRMLSLAPMTFDVGLAEALFVLSNAGHLKMVDDYQRVGSGLLEQLKDHNVTHLSVTPSVLETLGNPDNISKDIVISVGAEKVSAKLFSKWSKNHIIVNLYGPTEATINSLSFVSVRQFNGQIVPIGTPDIGVSAVILDDALNPVPIGFKGELYLGGTGLARGYINNFKETALKFIPSLFAEMGTRIYRTGDLASISEDGNIILHGRIDDQLKIRGLRIDPLEIENAFLSLENILMSWAGVIYDKDRPVLLAFIVNSLNKSLADVSLEYRKKLKSLLPQYLIPQVIISIEKLPLTNNGKIDKKEINNFYNLVKNNKKILENKSLNESKKSSLKVMLEAISNLLSIPVNDININNSFLEIGGDSIVALQLISKLKQNGYNLSANDLLESHSIKELSLLLDDDNKLNDNKSFDQVAYDKFIENDIVAEGNFNPLPIVKEYLSTSSPVSLFAYSLVINSPSDIVFKISDILKKIIFSHTALRTRYINKDKLQTLDVNDPNLIPQIINFDENIDIEFAKQTLGKLLNPYYARNIAVGILHYNRGKLLLVMVHHLASDIVSLQIILNDLKKYYDDDNLTAISDNSLKKCSFILNSKLNIKNYYNLSVINKASIISKEFDSKLDTAKKAKKRTISLSDKTTKNLFFYMDFLRKKISFKINLDIILIFIVSKVIGDIDNLGLKVTTIDLERNGRDDVVSGTVGWFTKIQKIYCLLNGTLEEKLESIVDQIYTTNSVNSSDDISEVLINYVGLLDKKLDNKRDLFTINNDYDDLSVVYDDNLPLRNPILLTILEKENQNNNKNIILDFIFSERLISSNKINNFINLILKEIDNISNNNEIFNQYLPLTYTQEGLIQIENENIKGKKAYVINMKLCFRGNLDVNKLYESWVKLLSRHSILNYSFHQDERGFYAKISSNKPNWDYVKLPANSQEFDSILKDIESDIKNHSFAINKAPLYKVKALSKGNDEHILIFCLHHILADGWSAPIMMRDLFSIYNGEKLIDIPNIANSIKTIKANVKENTKIKWRKYLRGAKSTYLIKDNTNDDGKRVENSWYFDDKDLFFIQNFCKQNQITLASVIHALWAKTLKQIVGSNTVSFGSVTSGRPSYITGIDQLVGLFSNSVPILVNFDKLNIVEIAKQIGSMLVLASEDPLSFSQLLQMSGSKDLFDNLLVLENYPFNSNKLFNPFDGIVLEKYEYEDGSHYPLTFIININSGINFRLSYNANAKFIVSIDDIKQLFIKNFNDLKKQNIISIKNNYLEEHIFNQLNSTSVYGISLSGAEYYLNVNQCEYYLSQLTRKLISLGCHIQKNIVLSLPRSLESVLLMVSILRTGACFVPIDCEIEYNRYLKIINKVKPYLIINTDSIYELGLNINFNINITLDFNKFSINERVFSLSDLNYAYIIHTSGTTGEPKGINMPWRTLNYLCKYHYKSLKLDKNLTIAHFAPNYFDVCIQEILTSFIFGHHLVIVPEDKRKNIDDLALFFEQQRVDVLFATNLIINQLAKVYVDKKIPNLSYLIQSGEKLEISDFLAKWCSFEQSPKLFNEYGPSETHVICVNHNNINLNKKDNISIGKQILGTKLFILDDTLSLLGPNKVGELYIVGEALSYGYTDDYKQTSIRYAAIPDYLGKDLAGKRMYRTGDIVYKDSEDQIYCIGRIDEQVKIKGVRVELEEIIKAFMSIEGIYKAYVIPNLSVNATALLSAVILNKQYFDKNKLTISSIKQRLNNLLPKNLIPDVIKIVDDVPVNKNNKLDKQELRKNLLQKYNIIINKEYFFENHDLSIDIIKSIIKFVLDSNIDISNDDDFFALGGHSLLATKLVNQINNAFNSNIHIKDIFELRTPINIFKFINCKSDLETKNYTYKRPDRVALGPAQMRFWALSELGLSGKTYHIPMTLRLTSISNAWNFNKLFNHFKKVILNLIFKHESLRTIINSDDKGIFQVVLNNKDVLRRFISVKKTINKQDIDTQIDNFHSQEFNLSEDLMLRFGLFNLNKTKEYIFLITLHHICCDAWSISIILNDIKNIFEFLLNNPQSTYTSNVTSYIDEIGVRDKKWQDMDVYNKDLNYWKKQLFNLTCPLNLPLDYKRTNNPQFKGDLAYFNFGKLIGEQLKSLSQQKSVTYFMLIQACIAILLNKMGCGDDIVIGVPDSGRNDIKSKEVVGCFINLLVLRFNLSGNPSFSDILNNIREVSLDAYSHVSISFDVLVRVLGFSNVKSHHPLFTVGVGLQDISNYQFNLEGFNIDIIDYHPKVSRYDINFDAILDNDNPDLKFVIEYDTNLFKKKTIHDLMDRLKIIIETVLLNSNQRLSDFNILLKEERLKFYNANNNYINHSRLNLNKKVLDIVNGEISNDFNLNILINDSKFSYSYKDLKVKSNKLAKFLVQNKVNFADNICIICSRNFSFYVGVLAVLRVGATYVPLLPDIPQDRLFDILKQTESKILITDQKDKFLDFNVKIIDINSNGSIDYDLNNNIRLPLLKSLSLNLGAYIIFTSGTTGHPKGILINRYSLACLLDYISFAIPMADQTIYLSLSPFCFDLAVYDVLGALSCEFKILILDELQRKDPSFIKKSIKNSIHSTSLTTPSLLSTLLSSDDDLDGFKKFTIFSAGEALPQNLANKMLKLGAQVFPMYGPAETVIVSNGSKYKKGPPSLGDDFRDVKTYVLDDYLNPVPQGVIGQIYLAGEQIANCYIGNKLLTSYRFVANRFFKGRMYCSGDLGFIKNNKLYFAGRIDNQVSIRGHRVEITEILSSLNLIAYIKSCAVKVIKKGVSTIIVAYVVFDKQKNIPDDINDIKNHLSNKLPDYMIPSIIIPLDHFPLTVNGKINLQMLPEPTIKEGQKAQSNTQKEISNILSDLIFVNNPNIDDNFIELGMDSISVIILSNKLNSLGYNCTPKVIFDNQTINLLAKYLDKIKLSSQNNIDDKKITDNNNLVNLNDDKLNAVLANWSKKRSLVGDKDE